LDRDRHVLAVPRRPVGLGLGVAELGLAGERGVAVDADAAGAADRRPAGAADRQGPVLVGLGLQQPVEGGERRLEVDVEGLPVGAALVVLLCLWLVAPD